MYFYVIRSPEPKSIEGKTLVETDGNGQPPKNWEAGFGAKSHEEALQKFEEHKRFYHVFWQKRIPMKEQLIIFGGVCHVDGGDRKTRERGEMLGFGGHRWYIQMNDGRLITTNNLWCNGDIPVEYREQLPDNAVSLTEKEFSDATQKRANETAMG